MLPLPRPNPRYKYFPFREVAPDLYFAPARATLDRLVLPEPLARPLDPARVEALAESIASLGRVLLPLLVYPKGGQFWILDGAHRYMALKKLAERGIRLGPVDVLAVELKSENAAYAALASALSLNFDQHTLSPLERALSLLWYLRTLFAIHTPLEDLSEVMAWLSEAKEALESLPDEAILALEKALEEAPPSLDEENEKVQKVVDEIVLTAGLPHLRPLLLQIPTRGLFYWAAPFGGVKAVLKTLTPLLRQDPALVQAAYEGEEGLKALEEALAPNRPPQTLSGGTGLDAFAPLLTPGKRGPSAKTFRALAQLLRKTRPLYRKDPEVKARVDRILEEAQALLALLAPSFQGEAEGTLTEENRQSASLEKGRQEEDRSAALGDLPPDAALELIGELEASGELDG